ncbi:MAG: 2-C-methyl-D-erythritol 4-phosphate cytidylyltransferase [Crocinitomicaceae bacterium]|nr:2-C-methyl-D-erythritol 4-phosphate cytidylyltransferase [Crocinitomicaceae bacterium]|tara:strand:- start:477 stop:1142 length:666 start_codon:yes stop_codon:yes gene_type:complete
MSRFVLIVAGGTGKRMKTKTAKQFLSVKGLPLMWWTLRRFKEATPDAHLSIVLNPNLFDEFKELEEKYGDSGSDSIILGGVERFHSVLNGLTTLPDEGIVAIHDAVRPFPTVEMIRQCFDDAAIHGSAIPVTPLKNSIRSISPDGTSKALNRSNFLAVQTPQCFDLALIKPAFAVDYNEVFTDDASVYEAAGHQVFLSKGDHMNLKITTKEDLIIARALSN